MKQDEYIVTNSGLPPRSVSNTLSLLGEGATVPFIARYRKERTGGLDEVEIAKVRDLAKKYEDLISRQQTILTAIEEQSKMTPELKEKVLFP